MTWQCAICTFMNQRDNYLTCEVCNTARSQPDYQNLTSSIGSKNVDNQAPEIPIATPVYSATHGSHFASSASTLKAAGALSSGLSSARPLDWTDVKPSAPALWQETTNNVLQPVPLATMQAKANRGDPRPSMQRTDSSRRGDMIDSIFGENDDQRKLFDELRETERTYVESLQIAVGQFYQPLLQRSENGRAFLSSFEIKAIFSNLDEILALNQTLLTSIDKELSKLKGLRSGDSLAGAYLNAFTQVLPDFDRYSVYINNYRSAVDLLKSSTEAKPPLASFLQETSSKPICRNLGLGSYLIMPVQRLCKYPLFFESLLKQTNKDHISYSTIQEAAAKMKDITERVNLSKGNAERSIRGLQIANQLEGVSFKKRGEQIISADRIYLDEWTTHFSKDSFRRKLGLEREKKPRVFFLFNNLLVVAKKLAERRYELRLWLPLQQLLLKDASSQASNNDTGNSAKGHLFALELVHANVSGGKSYRNSIKQKRSSHTLSNSYETYTMWFTTQIQRKQVWEKLSNAVLSLNHQEPIKRSVSVSQQGNARRNSTQETLSRPKSISTIQKGQRLQLPIRQKHVEKVIGSTRDEMSTVQQRRKSCVPATQWNANSTIPLPRPTVRLAAPETKIQTALKPQKTRQNGFMLSVSAQTNKQVSGSQNGVEGGWPLKHSVGRFQHRSHQPERHQFSTQRNGTGSMLGTSQPSKNFAYATQHHIGAKADNSSLDMNPFPDYISTEFENSVAGTVTQVTQTDEELVAKWFGE